MKRFHRALREYTYRRDYDNPADAQACLADFHARHSTVRRHWALVSQAGGDPVTPLEVYEGVVRPRLPRWQTRAREAKANLDTLRERPAA